MEFEELIALCDKNKKLKDCLVKLNNTEDLFEVAEFNGKWDAEDKSNFENPTLGLLIDNEWELANVHPKFAKLYDNYNWDGISLSDGRYVFVLKYGDIYVVKSEKLTDGGVELTVWGLADKIKEGTDAHAMLYGIRNDPKLN